MRRDTHTPTYYDPYPPRDTPAYDIIPDPIYGFVGEVFSWGLAGGSTFHFDKGYRASPSGARLAGAVNAVRWNAPGVAGKFGAYCVLCFAMESAVSLATGRDDTFAATAAVAAASGLHGMRRGGAPAAAWYAVLGATGYMGVDYAIRPVSMGGSLYSYEDSKLGDPYQPRVMVMTLHSHPMSFSFLSPHK